MNGERGRLDGCRVAVTRPAATAAELADRLARDGAEPLLLPLIETLPPSDPGPLAAAAHRIAEYDWIAFTSATAVRALAAVLANGSLPEHARIAAVGPATAAAVEEQLGRVADAVPADYTGGALAAALAAATPLRGVRVLWPRAHEARDELPSLLRHAGARLDDPVAYRTAPVHASARELHRLIALDAIHAITLMSPSAAHALAAAGTRTGGAVIAVIGTSTAEAARAAGLPVHVRPAEHTIPALVEALARYHHTRGGP